MNEKENDRLEVSKILDNLTISENTIFKAKEYVRQLKVHAEPKMTDPNKKKPPSKISLVKKSITPNKKTTKEKVDVLKGRKTLLL